MKKLYELEPAEVSLVPKGANKKKFLIFKNEKGEGTEMSKPNQELLELVKKADPEVLKQVEKIIKDDAEANGGKGLDNRAQAAIKAVVRILLPFKEQISNGVLGESLKAAGFNDRGGGAADLQQPMAGGLGVEKACTDDDMKGAKEAANKAFKEHMAKMGVAKYPDAEMQMKTVNKEVEGDNAEDDDDEGEDVSKTAVTKADGSLDLSAVPETVRPAVEAIYKGNQELVKKNAELETMIKEERDQRKNREIVAKADTFTHLGLPKEDIVASLKDADATSKEAYERVCKNFEALNKQAETSKLFAEVGSSNSGSPKGANADAKINAAVEGIVQKSAGGVTKEAAYEQFIRTPEGQRLYNEYKNERGGI